MRLASRVSGAGILAFCFFGMASCSWQPKPVAIIISNPIDLQRINEGVVVPLAKLPAWTRKQVVQVQDPSGTLIPSQSDDLDGDGLFDELYFQMSLAPRETATLGIYAGGKPSAEPPPFKVMLDHDLVSIETATRVVVSKGPEEMQIFIPGRKSVVLTASYSLQGVATQESQNRILSQGPLRTVVEQKALWRSGSEAYIFNHRLSVAVDDPLIRSSIEKVRWPQGSTLPPLAFGIEEGGYRLRSFSTRWLLSGEGKKAAPWNGAFLFKASTLLQPKPVNARKEGWVQVFNAETNPLSVAWMVDGSAAMGSGQDWDRQTERFQQRWLNPIEVFVSE